MRDLNRFEYLQLAAALLSEKDKQEEKAHIVVDRLFELAIALQEYYHQRYKYEGGDDVFNLLTTGEKNA